MNWIKKHRVLIIIVIFFATVYSLISLVNHYYFRTFALDLGVYTNALYDYAHFQWNDSSVFKEAGENLLADHFDLYLFIFAPFSFIFGTYTLLILQIFFILLGGIGVYKYFTLSSADKKIPLFAALYFYLFFGVFSALAFDYHSNVIAAMIVPWFFYFFKQKKYIFSGVLFFLILISKENIALWMLFVCIGLLFEYRKDRSSLLWLSAFAAFSILYFFLITFVVMPAISSLGKYTHFDYSVLGGSFSEAFVYLISHPIRCIGILFTNHTSNPLGDYVKMELHILLLVSGLFMLFRKPYFLIMLIPIYFQKLFHNDISMWSFASQYNIEYAPIFAIGIFTIIGSFKKKNLVNIFSVLVLVGVLATTVRIMDHTTYFTSKSRIRFYQASHYQKNYDVGFVYKQMKEIPEDAVVSAQSPFLPHLALRDKIYQFPIVKDADYIIFSPKENPYPLSKEDFDKQIQQYKNSPDWQKKIDTGDLIVLKRISGLN